MHAEIQRLSRCLRCLRIIELIDYLQRPSLIEPQPKANRILVKLCAPSSCVVCMYTWLDRVVALASLFVQTFFNEIHGGKE